MAVPKRFKFKTKKQKNIIKKNYYIESLKHEYYLKWLAKYYI